MGRLSSLVRLMSRRAKTLSALNSAPGVLGSANTIVVLLASGGGAAADDGEAGDVVLEILHRFLKDLETEDLGRAPRGQRRCTLELLLGDELGSARGVVDGFDRRPESLQVSLALRERLRMGVDDLDVRERRAGERLQAMDDVELDFAGDPELVIEQQVVVAVNRAADGVLERNDAMRRPLLDDRLEDLVERLAGQRLDVGPAKMQRGCLAVGARFSLIRDSHNGFSALPPPAVLRRGGRC